MENLFELLKSTAGACLFVVLSTFSLSAQTESKEDLVYIQQAQYQQEMSYKQAANPTGNHAVVDQRGKGHIVNVEQTGRGLNASVTQTGSHNAVSLKQEGKNLEATIRQSGHYLQQEILQVGSDNQLSVEQTGSLNGSAQPFSYEQSGTGHNVIIKLKGASPPVVEVIQSN